MAGYPERVGYLMFQKDIAKITADHLRTHIKVYLDQVNAAYDKLVTLEVPQTIDVASMAGGVMAVRLDKLPAYGVDCIGKAVAVTTDDLIEYQYDGHIAGTIVASDRDTADDLVKRHERAVETFIRDHQFLHQPQNLGFTLREMGFLSANFSGALLENVDDTKEIWLAGFVINLGWITSEDGPRQHS
jgi:hypothetical protein